MRNPGFLHLYVSGLRHTPVVGDMFYMYSRGVYRVERAIF